MEPLEGEQHRQLLNIGTQRVIGKILLLQDLYGHVRLLERENQNPDQMTLARVVLKQVSENVCKDLEELFERYQDPIFRKARNAIGSAGTSLDDGNYVAGLKATHEGFEDLTKMVEKKVFNY
ncbi:hypothetical protein FGW20_08200 [Methanoculleus sp. FWC-SCC3]|uniref:Uncharacterized protein n=1 Tax=Methanoculleus methanifontis TaxID=2584086 RepID=A0ABT8M1U4_9EURY|nr:hypothetical protein [Methanoculleus sp. FWC-SCC3]MDN7013020.1 hypothetical protein [Methanoculleus sp. FWC-SCC3]